MKRIRLEGLGRDVEIGSCKVSEYGEVRRLLIGLLDAGNEENIAKTIEEIAQRWLPGIDPGDLTLDDAWEVLIAKAGKAQGEILRRMPEIAAERMVDFLRNPELSATILAQAMQEMTTGEN